MNLLAMQKKATAKINQYGRSMSMQTTPSPIVYTDSITGVTVASPVNDYDGNLINPVTGNLVTASAAETTLTFKGLEVESTLIFGDYTSDAKFLGGLISEDTITFMIPATITVDVGSIIKVDGIDRNVIKIMPMRPGDITVYNIIQVKR